MRSCLCWLFSIQWSSHSETWQQRPRLWSSLCNVNASWQFLSLISTRAVICQRMLITSLSPAGPLMGNKRNARRERVRDGGRPRHNVSSVRHPVWDCGDPGLVTGSRASIARYRGPGGRTHEPGVRNERRELRSEMGSHRCGVWPADSLQTPEMLGVMTTDTFQIITQWQIQSDTRSDNWRPREWRLWRLHSLIHYGHQSLILKFLFWEESVKEGLEWKEKKEWY